MQLDAIRERFAHARLPRDYAADEGSTASPSDRMTAAGTLATVAVRAALLGREVSIARQRAESLSRRVDETGSELLRSEAVEAWDEVRRLLQSARRMAGSELPRATLSARR
jgi:hypothetical protein